MLADKFVTDACPSIDRHTDGTAQPDTRSNPPDEKGRGVPAHIRKLAREAANRHDLTLAGFLAEAIVSYAARLDDEDGTRVEMPSVPVEATTAVGTRLAALENRIRALEAATKIERTRTHAWLENYVERPWMRNRGY